MGQRTLGELIDSGAISVTTGFPCGSHNDSGEGVPHIRPFNVCTDGTVSLTQKKFIAHAAAQGKPTLCTGDILFNNTNSKELVGKCAVWDIKEEYVFSNHMTKIHVIDQENCDSYYLSYSILYHWMIGASMQLARSHVAQASIIGERFREIELPWVCLQEQQNIASVLKALQVASSINERELTGWSNIKHATMHKLFTYGLRGEPQKETEIGLVPESWELTAIDEIAVKTQYGLSIRGNSDGRYPILRMNCQVDGKVEFRDLQYVDVDDDTFLSFKLNYGDILFNRTNSIEHVGRTALYTHHHDAVFASYLIRLTVDAGKCLPEFINHYMNWPTTQREIKKLASRAVGQANINATKLRTVKVSLPQTLDEQQEIVAILDAIDQKIDLHRRKKTVLEELFKSLLHKLMTGEVRADDLDLSALEDTQPQAQGGAA